MTTCAMRSFGIALTLLASTSVTASTQQGAPSQRNLLSINPLGLPFEYVAAEYEGRVSDIATLGISASYFGPSDFTLASFEAKVRLYPNEEAPRGFSIGITGGVARIGDSNDVFAPGGQYREHNRATRPTVGAILDYNWLLGKKKRVLVGTGLGAKRLFGDHTGFGDVNFAYPVARLQVGVAF